MDPIRLRLTYDGLGPIVWSRAPDAFGLQDKAGHLHLGAPGRNGTAVFDLTLQVKPDGGDAPVFIGEFAHGLPRGRFLYLGWRDTRGAFAQRLKIPLGGIAWDDVRAAQARGKALVATLVDHHPRITSTGANIGGTRAVSWALA